MFRSTNPEAPLPTIVKMVSPVSATLVFVIDGADKLWVAFVKPDGTTEWRYIMPVGVS